MVLRSSRLFSLASNCFCGKVGSFTSSFCQLCAGVLCPYPISNGTRWCISGQQPPGNCLSLSTSLPGKAKGGNVLYLVNFTISWSGKAASLQSNSWPPEPGFLFTNTAWCRKAKPEYKRKRGETTLSVLHTGQLGHVLLGRGELAVPEHGCRPWRSISLHPEVAPRGILLPVV